MDVQLEILQGRLKQGKATAGVNRFQITLSRFIIGSDPACHMVCQSRTISERHCLILIDKENVLVRDLDSRTGTFINDVPVEGTQLLDDGDKLRIGRLEFRLLVTPSRPPSLAKTPPESNESVKSIETVVGTETVDTLVTNLLQQEDDAAREARYADPAARYYRTDQIPPAETAEPAEGQSDQTADQPTGKSRKTKKDVGKLPAPPPIKANDSVSAAELALQEIFHPAKKS